MIHLLTRKASLVLVFGLFFITSCSSLNKAESSNDSSINTGPFTEIENINKEIEANGTSESLLRRKTQLFVRAAQNELLPTTRKPLYRNAINTARDGANQFSDNSSVYNQILIEAWSLEHNNGVRLLQAISKQNRSQTSFENAVAHLENAIILQPDSLQSYNVLATAYYSNGLYTNAVGILNKILEVNSNPEQTVAANEKKAFIYLESGDTNKAVSVYQNLHEENRSSITLTHGLVNAYILNNQPEQAALLLQELNEEYPDQVSYRESLASVKYQLFKDEADSLLSDTLSSNDFENEIAGLISQLIEIKDIYEDLYENSLLGEESIFSVAAFHTNGAEHMKDLRTQLNLNDSVSDSLAETEDEFLELSLKYWEQLAELNPDNVEYLYTLYNVYNRLQMFEEAENIEQSFNF